jgi:hypothetical protein
MTLRRLLFRLPLLALLFAAGQAAAQGDPSFYVVNRSGQAINEIYVSPTREPYWGHDLLGRNVLPNGQSFPVRLAPTHGCRFDVRVVYADGRPEERRDQDTCQIAELVFGTGTTRGVAPSQAPSPSQAANPSFNLVNRGRNAIREIYVSSARDSNWGSDRLGANTLPPGRHLEVRLPLGDCVNDVRIVWMDGRAEERRALDTCRLVNLVFQ